MPSVTHDLGITDGTTFTELVNDSQFARTAGGSARLGNSTITATQRSLGIDAGGQWITAKVTNAASATVASSANLRMVALFYVAPKITE